MAIIRPGPKFHEAFLLVKREELYIDRTIGFVDSWWLPDDQAGVIYCCLGQQGNHKLTVCTETPMCEKLLLIFLLWPIYVTLL